LIRLRQATGHTSILSTKVSESAKLDRLKELVSDIIANGEKVVIFSNWKDIVDIIQSELLGYNPAIITGEVNTEQRSVEVDRFQTDKNCKVLIGTIGAAGTGITLTAASNVIFFDIPWTCGIFEQAVDRCHRIGQNKTVNIYELITKNTIDERVHDIVRQKGELSDRIVDSKALVNYYLS
jgi:SNF2 family DNA or RNA helicase